MQRLSAKMTPDAFLAWEREQTSRHHYVRGDIFDMAGGSPRHNALSAELASAFATALKGSGCRTFSADQRLGVASDLFVYADVSLVCGPLELREGTKDVVTNPALVVEVLSRSTEAYDRSDKLNDYLALASIEHVLLVSQSKARIDLYTRGADGQVRYQTFGSGASITLEHPSLTLDVDAVYAGIFDLPGDD